MNYKLLKQYNDNPSLWKTNPPCLQQLNEPEYPNLPYPTSDYFYLSGYECPTCKKHLYLREINEPGPETIFCNHCNTQLHDKDFIHKPHFTKQ